MAGFGSAASSAERSVGTRERQLGVTAARLFLSILSFGVIIVLEPLGLDLERGVRAGLYWTFGFAIFATLVSGVGFQRTRSPERFAALQLISDVVIVTSLVHFSGGRDSLFIFLYALVPVYGAVLFGGLGAFGAATLSAIAYAVALFGSNGGWLGDFGGSAEVLPIPVLATTWGVHVGALFMVGALASVLAGDLSRTGEALNQRTKDLRTLRDLHQRTVESVMSGLLTTDELGRITSFNPEAERITARRADEAIGLDFEEVIPGARELVMAPQAYGRHPVSQRARLRVCNRRGEELCLGVASSVLKDVEGSPVGHVVIFQDLTEVVILEGDLRRSERLAALGEMGAKIAHEIRNPLAAISGSIELLRKNHPHSPVESEAARLMDIVEREADRLNRLLTDFLRYARPAPPKRLPVDLKGLVDEVLETFASACPENVEVTSDGFEAITVLADAEQMHQVLWNLILNAVQAMPEGGRLEIRSGIVSGREDQGEGGFHRNRIEDPDSLVLREWAEICVVDSGPGIPEEVQERMFEPFFTTRPDGTGLGLATVHRIVTGHGGLLLVESAEGRGTSVRIRLPVWESQELEFPE